MCWRYEDCKTLKLAICEHIGKEIFYTFYFFPLEVVKYYHAVVSIQTVLNSRWKLFAAQIGPLGVGWVLSLSDFQ